MLTLRNRDETLAAARALALHGEPPLTDERTAGDGAPETSLFDGDEPDHPPAGLSDEQAVASYPRPIARMGNDNRMPDGARVFLAPCARTHSFVYFVVPHDGAPVVVAQEWRGFLAATAGRRTSCIDAEAGSPATFTSPTSAGAVFQAT